MKKLLFLLFALVVSIGNAWADNKTVYLNPGVWDADGAVFSAHVFNGSGEGWILLTETVSIDGNTCYKVEVPDTWTGLNFVRQDPNGNLSDWSSKWNQTSDLTLTDIENKLVTITGWDYSQSTANVYSASFATGLDWENVYAYPFTGTTPLFGWPGKAMTATANKFTIDGVEETIYSILFSAASAPGKILFNDGTDNYIIGESQTPDLAFTDGKFYVLPTANPTAPTEPDTRVIAVFSKTYNKELTESNNGWGGGPDPKYTSFDFPVINDGHYVVHVNGTAINGRASAILDADHSTLHVALWPKTATSCKIWDDNKYDQATVYTSLTPGQWNYVEIENVSFTTNYIGIELYNGANPETEFYLDHFYFSKPASGDATAPTFDTHSLKSANCISATLTLQATDETSETITYKVIDAATSTVYQTTGASGTAIDFTISPLAASTEYVFSVVAMDENGNETAAETINATTTAIPDIPEITATENHLLWDGNDGGAKNGFGFFDWGGGTGSAQAINEKNGYLISNFKWFGSQFTEVDASEMTYLEIDVLPSKSTTLAIVPINLNVEGAGNQPEKGTQFNVTAGEWNKLKIPVADVIENDGVTMTRLFQIKFVSSVIKSAKGSTDGFANGDGNTSFYVGNVYLWKETGPATKTVTFINSGNWAKPYAYAWYNDGTNDVVVSSTWPGDEMTNNGNGTFTWTTTGDPTKIIFSNNGSTQTADLDFVDGATYTPAGCQYSVSFKNSIGWEDVYAYTYGPETLGAWPGTKMTKDGNVWAITFSAVGAPTNIIFNNGNTGTDNQTDNLEFENGKEYDMAASMVVTVIDGVATVTGIIRSTNVSAINNADAMFIDLAGVTEIEENVVITPKHANALIRVSGTAGDPATMDEKYNNATITGNKVVRRNDGYIFPVEKIQFVDDPANEPMWNGEGQPAGQKFISAGNTGFKVTRTLKAKAIGTIYLPGNSITLPDGVTVWEATAYTAADGITFTKAGVAGVFFPYVVINANNEDVAIYSEGVGDFNLIAWGTGNVAPHKIGESDAYAQGCMSTIVTSANDNPLKYAVSSTATHSGGATANVTLQPCKGVTISPFRAFFYGFDASGAPIMASFDDGTTGIGSIDNGQQSTDNRWYDLSGRRVENPTKGIYIVNGKKVVVK